MTKEALLTVLLLLAVDSNAQSSSTSDAGVVTSFYSVCPTATSTTITLPTTITYCPGPNCNGGGPAITSAPIGQGAGGIQIGEYTSLGPDGKDTILGIYRTIVDHLGPNGIVPATYTITEPCPCHGTMPATVMPSGFETTVVPCHVCAATGGPATITLTQPCPTGPYASQTPYMGQPNVPAAASGSVAPAAPAPAAGSGSSSGGSGSGSGSPAPAVQCVAGQNCPAGGAAAPSTGMKNNSTSPIVTPPILPATGAAQRTVMATSSLLFAFVIFACSW